MRPNSNTVICDYCGQPAQLVEGRNRPLWECKPCDAWIPAHAASPTLKPVGRLANAELRAAKREARQAFESIMAVAGHRSKAFRWLAEQMQISTTDCHVDLFDLEQCRQMTTICRANLPKFGGAA